MVRPGSAGSGSSSKRGSRSPTTGWWKRLSPWSWRRTLWPAQRMRNSSLRVASSPTRSVRLRSSGFGRLRRAGRATVASATSSQSGKKSVALRVEEREAGEVGRVRPGQRRRARTGRGRAGWRRGRRGGRCGRGRGRRHGVEQPLHTGPDVLVASVAACGDWRCRWLCGRGRRGGSVRRRRAAAPERRLRGRCRRRRSRLPRSSRV